MSSTDPSTDSVPSTAHDVTDIDLADAVHGDVATWDEAATEQSDDDAVSPPNPDQLDGARAIAAELQTYGGELAGLDTAELNDHVEYYQRAHAHLQRALSDIDQA